MLRLHLTSSQAMNASASRTAEAPANLDTVESRPLTGTAVLTLPLATALGRAGLDLVEIHRDELPASIRHTFTGMLAQTLDDAPFVLLPYGQDQKEREQAARQLIWRYLTEANPDGKPIYLPGSEPACTVPGCTNDHQPDPGFDGPNTDHYGPICHANTTSGQHVIGAWYTINNTSRPYIRVETFPTDLRLGATDARAFADQLRHLANAIERDAEVIDAFTNGDR